MLLQYLFRESGVVRESEVGVLQELLIRFWMQYAPVLTLGRTWEAVLHPRMQAGRTRESVAVVRNLFPQNLFVQRVARGVVVADPGPPPR